MSFFEPDPPVRYRPLSLSIIGWYHVISGFFGLLFAWVPLTVPSSMDAWAGLGIDPAAMVAFGFASNLVYTVAGAAILKRRDWGRILLLVALPSIMVASAFFNPGFRMLAAASGLITLGIYAYFLTREAANDYFSGAVIEMPESLRQIRQFQRSEGSGSDLKRTLAVILALPAWWVVSIAVSFLFSTVLGGSASGILVGLTTLVSGLGLGLLAIGALLWGPRRWKAYLGWGLLSVGLIAVMLSLFAALPFDIEGMLSPEQLDAFDPDEFEAIMRAMGRYALVTGVAVLSAAALLLSRQRTHDLDSVAQSDAV